MSTTEYAPTIPWPAAPSVDKWLKDMPVEKWKNEFQEKGYLVIDHLLTPDEVTIFQDLSAKMLNGEINTSNHRHDLGNITERKVSSEENICQIMWPSLYFKNMVESPLHTRTKAVAKIILGDDADCDFDMFISKAPHTDTETPWHQDESYWGELEDPRAVSCWMAVDDAFKDNGCMWFIPGSHKTGLRQHRKAKEGCHVNICDIDQDSGQFVAEIKAGGCTFHHGRTLHYTYGNSTDKLRRAYITVYRPQKMIEMFRKRGFDHGKQGIHGVIPGV